MPEEPVISAVGWRERRRILFLDRDGTLNEETPDEQ